MKLIILGAGDYGRTVEDIARQIYCFLMTTHPSGESFRFVLYYILLANPKESFIYWYGFYMWNPIPVCRVTYPDKSEALFPDITNYPSTGGIWTRVFTLALVLVFSGFKVF